MGECSILSNSNFFLAAPANAGLKKSALEVASAVGWTLLIKPRGIMV